ncbi:DUF397 domain-containing protein [Nocardiopsis sp. NPDC050513]|uniref:DUF397 domain-containing protein n=1 Tax=Nocardiopsis sp. NPDC050513 TaxID=3364338 RepID=UPI0037899C83
MNEWHTSTYSSQGAHSCVEVNEMSHAVLVRDTENRDLGHLSFTPSAWSSFLGEVKGDTVR